MTNIAGGHATVEAQIGVVQGNAVFHRHETVYRTDPGDTPERRLQVALANLDAGSARVARRLLHDLLVGEQPSTRIAYYSALAVVHGRGPRDLGSVESGELEIARRVANRFPPDEWRIALDVVVDLVTRAVDPDRRPDERSAEVVDRLERLPRDRYTEVVRHLDVVLDSVNEGRVHAARSRLLDEQRHEDDRLGQAWKFFEPDPVPPKQGAPGRVGLPGSGPGRALAALCALATLYVLVEGTGIFTAIFYGGGDAMQLALIAAVLGAVLMGVFRQAWALPARHVRHAELEHEARVPDVPVGDTEVERGFAAEVVRLVDVQARRRAADEEDRSEGLGGRRWALAREVVETYGKEGINASGINWLIRARVQEMADLPALRARSRSGSVRYLVAVALVVIAFISVSVEYGAYSLISLSQLSVVALALCAHGVGELVGALRWRAESKRMRVERFHQDRRVHAALVEVLRSRPGDARIARWLDHDKAMIKISALRRCGLASRDVLAQVVLVEGARDAARARVLLGPPRYSAYVVRVFFLTARGVRQIEVDLDLLDGSVHNERRASFRYDALASARVFEVGVRFAKGLRQLVVPDQAPVDDDALVLSQAFSLSLVNGESITVVVENFEGLRDAEVESLDQLRNLALDTAGVVDALRVLEAVASEGQEWTARELDQRHWRRPDPVAAPST